MNPFTPIRQTAETALHWCKKQDGPKTTSALLDLTAACYDLLGPTPTFSATFKVIDQARGYMEDNKPDEAWPLILALVAKFRQVESGWSEEDES
jgi:hypothetical protein